MPRSAMARRPQDSASHPGPTRRSGRRSAPAILAVSSAAAICDRPALWTHRKSTRARRFITPPEQRSASWSSLEMWGNTASLASSASGSGRASDQPPDGNAPPTTWAPTKLGTDDGAIPANVFEKRPTVMAGLAKLVELVKKYARTDVGTDRGRRCGRRPERAKAKITSSSPSVATTSERKWAGDARCFVEMLDRGPGEHDVGHDGPADAPGDLGRQVGGGVAPRHAPKRGIDEGDDRVEVAARDRAEHQDDREQARGGRRGVLEQLQARMAGRELLRRDARPDDERSQEGAAEELGEQTAPEHADGRMHGRRPRGQQQCERGPHRDARLVASLRMPRRSRRTRGRRRRRAPCRSPRRAPPGPSTQTLSWTA